jgi:sec-independent protein translocase protein TatA
MISGFGVWELGLVLLLVFFFFGSKRIPVIGRGLGTAIRNFKGELREGDDSSDERLLKDAPDTEQR